MAETVERDLPTITLLKSPRKVERGPGGKDLYLAVEPWREVRGYVSKAGTYLFGWCYLAECSWWECCVVDLTGAVPTMTGGLGHASEIEARQSAAVAYLNDTQRS
jgi:hypothetical protein